VSVSTLLMQMPAPILTIDRPRQRT